MRFLLIVFALMQTTWIHATIWHVGPTRSYTYCSQVANLVQTGDTVEIDYAVYVNDPQVQWNKANLYIVGVGGRPRLEAGSIIANDAVNGKGIFVTNALNITISNIEFANAHVIDHNGAGIRQQAANLKVTACKFIDNEMGILCGSIANCKTTIEYSEFVNNGSSANPGYEHNVYINNIDTLVFRYNLSMDATAQGHELKSRAKYNFILYNLIANISTTDSRTIDLPNGGTSVIVGNIIEQSANSANTNILGYGLEGLTNAAPHRVWIHNNTFINRKTSGSFIHVATGTDTLWVKNNIFAGVGNFIGTPAVLDSSNNRANTNLNIFQFQNLAAYDYHLTSTSPAVNVGMNTTKKINGYALHPSLMYLDVANVEARPVNGATDVGAFEYVGAMPLIFLTPLHARQTDQDAILLNWATEQEINVAVFKLERSKNAIEWQQMAEIQPGQTNYRFVDENPWREDNYYRLQTVDLDGHFEYSTVAYVKYKQELSITPAPNPSSGQLALSLRHIGKKPFEVIIINASGMPVYHESVDSDSENSMWYWSENNPTPGVYSVVVQTTHTKAVSRWVVLE
ncbi:MAG: hypothetical protein IT269_00295 [Saprospiraceae bacterium]|nr:hypothetical protein [Saprospiraceae bacterium]